MNYKLSELSNWYVIQVKSDRSQFIIDYLNRKFKTQYKLIEFKKEMIHINKGKSMKYFFSLFPGYIFIYKDIDFIYTFLKSRLTSEFIKPVSFDGSPARVLKVEMDMLLLNSNPKGMFSLSVGYMENGDLVQIVQGPLKEMQGRILFINKKKRKAKVEISLFHRKMYISLGIDLVKKKSV